MKTLTFGLTCPIDGAELDLVTQADPTPLVQLHTTNDTRFRRSTGTGPRAGVRRRGKG